MARLDGLSFPGQLYRLAWPLRRQLFLVGGCLTHAVAAGDLAATQLVTPPGVRTLAMRVFSLLHAGVDDQVAGICLMNLQLFLALAIATVWILRWSRRE
jgi:ABC-type spermidine/putrescine transport system permease subunit II